MISDEYMIADDRYIRENEMMEEVKDLWIRNGVDVGNEEDRAKQVITAMLYRGTVVGVVTRMVLKLDIEGEERLMAYMRVYTDPNHRHGRMYIEIFNYAVALLEERGVVNGYVFNTENKKLQSVTHTKRMEMRGMSLLSVRSDDLYWYKLF